MAFHLFESIKLQVSIFFEFTWTVNYVLTVAEEGGDFRKILWCMGVLMAAIAVSTMTFAIYKHYVCTAKRIPRSCPSARRAAPSL